MEPEVLITGGRVNSASGTVAAEIEWVPIGGGGVSYIGPNGTPEERIHPTSFTYHVRFISPDRMIPDELREAASFEEASALAIKYANKLNEHAKRIAELGDDLKV